MAKFIDVKAAARRAGREEFFRSVKSHVIARFLNRKLLQGKQEGKKQLVADNAELAEVLRFGVERLVYNQQGFSFFAVRAPIELVAGALRRRPCVVSSEASVTPQAMRDGIAGRMDQHYRNVFAVQFSVSPAWTVVLQTIHWYQSHDAIMGTALAVALGRELKTTAAAAWDDDFSGTSMIVYEHGDTFRFVSDAAGDDGWVDFYTFFQEQKVHIPRAFIGIDEGTPATLYVEDPAAVERADAFVLRVPLDIDRDTPPAVKALMVPFQAPKGTAADEEAFVSQVQAAVLREALTLIETKEL